MIPKEILLEIAKKKGLINKEHIEKNYFQDILLFNLYKKINLLVFKGGTALYKVYNLPRFSEDLDFSILKGFNVENTIKEISKEINTEIKQVKKTKDSILIKLGFKGIITRYNTIRLDINMKNPVLIKPDIKSYIPDYIDINPFSMKVMNLKEIIAEKIHSIISREKARDLYDLFFLLRLTSIDRTVMDNKLKNFNMEFDYGEIKNKIEKVETLWIKELKPFILTELPDFDIVKDFVLGKLIR